MNVALFHWTGPTTQRACLYLLTTTTAAGKQSSNSAVWHQQQQHHDHHHPPTTLSIMQAPPIPPQRRQSAARVPPMPPPGVPVRAQATQSFPRPVIQPSSVRDHSLLTAPKTRPPNHPTRPAHLPQLSYSSSSTSSRSPALSYDSGRGHEAPAGGLRDSTRVNIKGSAPPRQVSARLDWEGSIKSPKEPDLVTPKEQYTAQIQVRDHLDTQFETLLARHTPSRCSSLLLIPRTRCRFPMLCDKSSTPSRKTSNRPSCTLP
jgi:hypothetical protein